LAVFVWSAFVGTWYYRFLYALTEMYSISVLMLYDIFKVIQNNNILNSAISSISLEKASLSLPLFPLYVHFLFFLSLIFIERKRLQWYGHVKRMQDKRLPKLIMEWIPGKRRKRGRPRKTWMEGVQAATKTRHLEADQWLNRKEWCLGSGKQRQLSQDRKDR